MRHETDRVRRHTSRAVLHRIDNAAAARLLENANAPEQTLARHRALDREWDTDRTIETEAAAVGLAGLALGVFVHRRFLVIPKIVAAALLLHAVTGWYPWLPVFRRLGIRSAREIARERQALKVLRGDFDNVGRHVTSDGQGADERPAGLERRKVPRGLH